MYSHIQLTLGDEEELVMDLKYFQRIVSTTEP
jgi:hypothetical protein